MIKMDDIYRLWEKGWPGRSREEMDAIIGLFGHPLASPDYALAFEKKKPSTQSFAL